MNTPEKLTEITWTLTRLPAQLTLAQMIEPKPGITSAKFLGLL